MGRILQVDTVDMELSPKYTNSIRHKNHTVVYTCGQLLIPPIKKRGKKNWNRDAAAEEDYLLKQQSRGLIGSDMCRTLQLDRIHAKSNNPATHQPSPPPGGGGNKLSLQFTSLPMITRNSSELYWVLIIWNPISFLRQLNSISSTKSIPLHSVVTRPN